MKLSSRGLFHCQALIHSGTPLGGKSIRDEKTVEKASGMVMKVVVPISEKLLLFILIGGGVGG